MVQVNKLKKMPDHLVPRVKKGGVVGQKEYYMVSHIFNLGGHFGPFITLIPHFTDICSKTSVLSHHHILPKDPFKKRTNRLTN